MTMSGDMTECPPEATLEQFLAGLLPEGDSTPIDRHVSSCETCASWVSEARSDEALLPALRSMDSGPEVAIPDQIAGYKILQRLGEGGMGVVYEAEQQNPRRRVALKVLRAGVASPRILRRFEHEAQVLGLLQHPGIAQIHEAGTFESESGRQPFFAMELVQGQPLMEHIRSQRPDLAGSLALVIRICEAVHHAHQKGVIHRDLKPGNILVDRHGQPKVLDFGVARLTEGTAETTTTLRTRAGELIGTLAYMSPEQVSGDPAAVDTRSDVYALAAICYQVLTGRLPHDLRRKSMPEAVRTIGEDEPTALSSVDRSLRGDLETIVLKGLEKDRDRRYQSAAELTQELGRFLRNEPIAARPPSTLYQLRKFARRNKALVGGVVGVFVVLVAGIVVSLVFWNKAEDAADVAHARQVQAEEEFAQAEAARDFLQEVLIQASPEQRTGGEPTIRDALATALTRVEELQSRPHVEAAVRHTLGRVQSGLHRYAAAEAQLVRSLELYEGLYGKEHQKIAYVLASLAVVYTREGHYDKAEATARRALSMQHTLARHPTIRASVLAALGLALYGRGELVDAERHTREAFRTYRLLEGADSVNVALTKGTLARILSKTDQPKEAEKLYRDALARQRKLLGPNNPSVAITAGSLAGFLATRGRMAEAEKLQREALAIQEAAFPEDHPAVGEARQGLGWLLCRRGKEAEGLPLVRDGVGIQKRALGKTHRRVAHGLLVLGTVLYEDRQYAASETALREAVESTTAAFGPTHQQTVKCLSSLGCALAKQGKHEDAIPLLQKSYELGKTLSPPADMTVSTSRAQWIVCLLSLGRREGARPLLDEILATVPRDSAEGRWAARTLEQLPKR